ncbi:sigma-70 family RNA polymerase sigma factor [Streptomyces sp. NPDC051684]|uniref:sigma-70 family RNA polymerase sigma factor n=1 Tax=Streptomyces sp. NPDC051684 TaxID=3365670 RepID=UPI0037BDE01A
MKEPVPVGSTPCPGPDLPELMVQVVQGDEEAFSAVYDAVAAPVFGLVFRMLRDHAQSEEVAQEVLIELWRTAAHYRPEKGTVLNWVLTLAHQRTVDRIRSVEAATSRERRAALLERMPEYDEVSEQVEGHFEREQLRRCLRSLSKIQRQSVMLAYYQGLTYKEVAAALSAPLGTIKTRMRDGLIRLRDCLGVRA